MALTTRKPLQAKCACGIKGYRSRETAEIALAKIQGRRLRDVMPKRPVQCWQGIWHLDGVRRVDTGPDRSTRDVVKERDDWTCASCGEPIVGSNYSIQHRIARGMGGTPDPAANTPANLILLCGSATTGCHGAAESRDQDMHRRGFWLESWEDPASVAVAHAVHGWVLLLPDGDFLPIPTGGAA